MSWFKKKRPEYVSPYQHIYDGLASDDPEVKEQATRALMASGPVPGSYGDFNSYGPGPCGHMGPYPGCPKCRTKFGSYYR